jgi:transcriptional regulator with XRE-family HTH domain
MLAGAGAGKGRKGAEFWRRAAARTPEWIAGQRTGPETGSGRDMDLEDSCGTSGALAGFCASLKRLQEASGISQVGLLGAAHLEKSQVSAILNGKIKRIPDWDVVIAVVRACLEYADAKGRPMPADLRDAGHWRQRYAKLVDEGVQVRTEGLRRVLPGRLLADVTDPFALEVHRPVLPIVPRAGLPMLPQYVAREHDAELGQVVAAAVQGASGIAVLVGGSSTGKTRACWEALGLL